MTRAMTRAEIEAMLANLAATTRHLQESARFMRAALARRRGGRAMSDDVDRQFDDLAQQVSRDAAHIKCTPTEYRDGLQSIIETLKTDRQASEETDPDEGDDA